MTFSKYAPLAIASFALVSACGGSDPAQTSETEKPIEKRVVTTETPTNTSPTPAPAPPIETGPAVEFIGFPAPYAEADYARGRRTFKLCQSCHTLKEGAGNLVGPNLYGMFGRQIGSVEGFTYSKAVQEADFVWTPDQLENWLENPRSFLPGNKMAFSGVRREADRHAVIAYVMSETGYTPPASSE